MNIHIDKKTGLLMLASLVVGLILGCLIGSHHGHRHYGHGPDGHFMGDRPDMMHGQAMQQEASTSAQ
jgi:hypothetical protein